MAVETTANIWTMVIGAGPVVKLVLIILVVFSILCWTVILAKIKQFRRARYGNEDFERLFWESPSLTHAYNHARKMSNTPMAGVFLEGYKELKRLQKCPRSRDVAVGLRVWLETLERSLEKGIQEELAAMERTLPFLATTGNAAPFIGLFGTVWGIMRSFHSIGLTGSASLATVAPGISEALVATAAGLAAAIPAVIAFNGFMSWMGRLEMQLQGFSNDFLNTVERQLLHGKENSQEPT
ncbi:MAG: protein TolQ [Deltaproteobacteria bacterium]|nr:protein TolQ [Deltaproteobacteria bacterium]MBW2098173.1 protein TolQ [Deltaproteobacteria bacterium]PXF54642.1 MAG: protein TolQ [Deltaproteobacteria bacterium]RKX56738.1 MAG: protein TolQ [Thermodesulfobacteriota bacterium]RLB76682.1 MAG: protein TolQ [Deltaproteobacteria bacterium]